MVEQAIHAPAGAGVAAFTLGIIAVMQFIVWQRERERGMSWFAAASLIAALLAAFDDALPPGGVLPNRTYVLGAFVVRFGCVVGLSSYLGLAGNVRAAAIAVPGLPMAAVAAALLGGIELGRPAVVAPLLYADACSAVLCLMTARRERDAGHELLAMGSVMGIVSLAFAAWRHGTVLLRYDYFLPATIAFGIFLLIVGLLRRSRGNRHAQAHAQRIAAFYAALSRANQTILRVKEPLTLYAEICRICVETGHAVMACVYLDEGTHAIRAGSAGPAATFLAGIPNPWDITTPQARASYTVQAMRDGVRLVCNDYLGDPRSAPWRAQAETHGIRAIAWLPLRRGGRSVGVLMLAAGERDYFDEPLVALLDELTADVSYALDNIDREAERLEASRQVQAGLERFSRLFHTAPVAAAIVSLVDRRVIDVNRATCERYGRSREQLIGHQTRTLDVGLLDEDREVFYAEMRKSGRVRNLVVRVRDHTGALHPELMSAEPIDYLGEPCHLVMSLDITDLRAAEEARRALSEARAASRAKTEFLSRMSHELRTPLNAVLGFSGLLRREATTRLTAQELTHLDHIQKAGWHLLKLINDVLDISRIEAGQLGVEVRGLELAPLLEEALQMSQPLAQERAVSLSAADPPTPRTGVKADPTRLRQVLLNVLSNAIKYNLPGGSVQVRVEHRDDQVSIEVVDTGMGMSTKQLERLFEPFNRLGRERGGIEGTGIGLALTRQLMRLMGGEIRVESEPGRGTRVLLTLPSAGDCVAAPATTRPVPLDLLPDSRSPSGLVLYIEDNAVNTLLVEQLLACWPDVQFVAAEDGRTGIELARALRPDLVLLDMQLPDVDGIEVLRHLRAEDGLQGVPVVALSASAMPEDIASARTAGALDYWTKPLDFQRFPVDVAQILKHA